jgi:hypothetical protein
MIAAGLVINSNTRDPRQIYYELTGNITVSRMHIIWSTANARSCSSRPRPRSKGSGLSKAPPKNDAQLFPAMEQ